MPFFLEILLRIFEWKRPLGVVLGEGSTKASPHFSSGAIIKT